MPDLRRLDDHVSVAPQLAPQDLAAIKAAGFTAVINNRPDGEEPDQPAGEAIRAAAAAAGLDYHAIPVAQGIAPAQIAATRRALEQADGPVLAFCRSGTRSAYLWALARTAGGGDPDRLAAQAAAAGYDLAPIRAVMERLPR